MIHGRGRGGSARRGSRQGRGRGWGGEEVVGRRARCTEANNGDRVVRYAWVRAGESGPGGTPLGPHLPSNHLSAASCQRAALLPLPLPRPCSLFPVPPPSWLGHTTRLRSPSRRRLPPLPLTLPASPSRLSLITLVNPPFLLLPTPPAAPTRVCRVQRVRQPHHQQRGGAVPSAVAPRLSQDVVVQPPARQRGVWYRGREGRSCQYQPKLNQTKGEGKGLSTPLLIEIPRHEGRGIG